MDVTVDDIKIEVLEEFREYLREPGDDNEALTELIVREGKFRDKVVVWSRGGKHVLVDGHRRYEIWCSMPEDTKIAPPRVDIQEFESEEAAKLWMSLTQLARRNLNATRKSLLRGEAYEMLKREAAGRPSLAESAADDQPDSTAQRLAVQLGSSPSSIKRDAKLFAAYTKLETVDAAFARDVRNEKVKLSRRLFVGMRELQVTQIRNQVKAIRDGTYTATPRVGKPTGSTTAVKPAVDAVADTKFLDDQIENLCGQLMRAIDNRGRLTCGVNKGNHRLCLEAMKTVRELWTAWKKTA